MLQRFDKYIIYKYLFAYVLVWCAFDVGRTAAVMNDCIYIERYLYVDKIDRENQKVKFTRILHNNNSNDGIFNI